MFNRSKSLKFLRSAMAGAVVVASVGVTTGIVPSPVGPTAAPPADAQSPEVTGIDIASWQHPTGQPIDWAAVRSAGHSFAVIKATEGATSPGGGRYTNPWFAQDWIGAGSAGLYRGAYHYAQPTADPADAVADARHFIAATGVMNGPGDLPPVLDLEEHNGLSREQVTAWTRAWLDEAQRLTGRQPIIYTGPYFWNTYVGSTSFTNYRLWIASYTSAPGPGPLPGGWPAWTIWQWTSSGTVPGIVGLVDMNRFCCGAATLAALAAGGGPQVGNPFGSVDLAKRLPGGRVEVAGWAIDPDSVDPIRVHIYVGGRYGDGGRFAGAATASVARRDVGRAYPQYGSDHGYATTVTADPSAEEVCVYAINTGPGNTNTLLGCRQPSSNPVGNLEAATVTGAGSVRLIGWAVDPDTADDIRVHVYANGRFVRGPRADLPRPDLAAEFGPSVVDHGFDTEVSVPEGPQEICVFGINAGPGTTNPRLGCRSVNVPGASPIGALDLARAVPGGIEVAGWAADIDTDAPVQVKFSVDGVVVGQTDTGLARRDVARLYPFVTDPGYATTVSVVGSGTRTVCATASNVGDGSARSLGCRRVTLGAEPFGNVDAVREVPGGVEVAGWALDPDTAGPVDVHVYVDGGWGGLTVTDVARPDVARVFPAFGTNRGFELTLPGLAPGEHRVCAYVINTGPGVTNPLLGCRTVTVTGTP